jgi:hypothetical protein
MKPRHALLTALAAVHLALVVCGAAGWRLLSERHGPGKTLALCRAMTGSDNGYGFYAPEVGSVFRARFILIDAAGRGRGVEFDLGNNPETRLRISNLVNMREDEESQDAAAASMAAGMFSRHPEARQVTVTIEEYDPGTMQEYRGGAQPRWEVVYEESFAR